MFRHLVLALLILAYGHPLRATGTDNAWREELNVYQKIYDAPLQLIHGQQSSIRKLANEKPLIIALVFTRCTGVCSPLLLRLKDYLTLQPARGKFRVLVLSFDPRDGQQDLQHMAALFHLNNRPGWLFGINSEIAATNQSIGFAPRWDSSRAQFDHEALLVGVNNQGFITRKLIGLRSDHDLRFLVASIENTFTPTYRMPGKDAMFSCFNYDPLTGKNKPGLGLLFIALPALLSFSLLVGIRLAVRRKNVEQNIV